jgi:hypothetical protein
VATLSVGSCPNSAGRGPLRHALGLGHADNLWEGFDLMAYGWASPSANFGRVPDISQCDVDALAYVWSWAMEGSDPAKPEALTFSCAETRR